MKIWLVRHVRTKKFMPSRMFRTRSAGWSWWEPDSEEEQHRPHDTNPRVFYTERSAIKAIAMWTQGGWRRSQGETHSYDGTEYYDEMELMKPDYPRAKGDLEIIVGELTLPVSSDAPSNPPAPKISPADE